MANELIAVRRLIADDAHALTFQTFGQYRTALLKAVDAALTAPVATEQAQAVGACVFLDFKQATDVLAMFGGEPGEVQLQFGDGHGGRGLYASYAEYPEEGAEYLGISDGEALSSPEAAPAAMEVEPKKTDADAYCELAEAMGYPGGDACMLSPEEWAADLLRDAKFHRAAVTPAAPSATIVYAQLSDEARRRTSRENIEDVLAALAQPAPVQQPSTLDVCTDSDNCNRCKTAPKHRGTADHAGIPVGNSYGSKPVEDEYDRLKKQKDLILLRDQLKNCKCDECGQSKAEGLALYCVGCAGKFFEAAPVQQDAPASSMVGDAPLSGLWHHGGGNIVCGTLRIARLDCDTNPAESFSKELLDWVCASLNAAQSKPEPLTSEAIEALCARIKAADDKAAEADYMLDSDDCIAVLRGTWDCAAISGQKPAEGEKV